MVERRDIDIILSSPIDWEIFRDKTILITGATGRLGMYLVEAVSKANIDWNLNITILVEARSEQKLRDVLGNSLEFPYIHTIIQDVTEPIHWDGGNIEYIFHTAGLASPKDFTDTPVDTLWGHVQGTHNILELARKKCTQKILYISTIEIYGECEKEKKIEETDMGVLHCDNARACYPEAKRLCETMLAAYEEQYGIGYVGIRLCHTFGPGIVLDDGRAFSEFIDNALNSRDIVLQSVGNAVRTYTYVADAIGAALLAFTKGKERYYNVANINNLISIRDLAEMIAGFDIEKKSKVVYAVSDEQKLKYLPFRLGVMDVSRIMKLGWRPQVDLEEAFRYTFDSFLQRSKI